MKAIWIMVVPLAGTVLGSALVFILRNELRGWVKSLLDGSAAGIMTAASVWSLLIPALEHGQQRIEEGSAFITLAGLMTGFVLMSFLCRNIQWVEKIGTVNSMNRRTALLITSVTLHNLPEGMAVGILLAGYQSGTTELSFASVVVAAAGVAIQNIPEGAIVSLPVFSGGMKRTGAFLTGCFSGLVELMGVVSALLLARLISSGLTVMLSVAAGTMLFVVVQELVPAFAQSEKHCGGTISFGFGFGLMMLLDVLFSG